MSGAAFLPMTAEDVRARSPEFLAVARDQAYDNWTLENFLADLPEKWSLSFVVEVAGQVAGYAVLSRRAPDRVHLHHFMLAPDHRGGGLGSRMLAEAESRARAAGARFLGLKVHCSAADARRFYLTRGFAMLEHDPQAAYLPLEKALAPLAVAIHQPNYLPWLGYFAKIARADVFVFLDDVQFSKGSYTNRVQILSPKGPRWLTVPVAAHLGDAIDRVPPSRPDWAGAHLDTLRGMYSSAPCFKAAWPGVRALLESAPAADLAAVNMHLVQELAGLLGLSCAFRKSSGLALASSSDDRLVEIVSQVAPGGTYISGKGGAKYQDPAKFAAAGLGFAYLDFAHPVYAQGAAPFLPGLSVLDAVFHLGWAGAAALLAGGGAHA